MRTSIRGPDMLSDMTDLTTHDVANATALPILEIGRAWMVDPATVKAADELGLGKTFGFWVNGRAGVLGEVDADLVACAIGFMSPPAVRQFWEARPGDLAPLDATVAYAKAAGSWGVQTLGDLDPDRLQHLHDLNLRIAAAALPSTGALFAGWRKLDPTVGGEHPASQVSVSLNVLREMRGGAHLSAVQAVGLGPDGALASNPDPIRGGVNGLERFGWTAPHPEPDATRRAEAEEMTSRIAAPPFEVLSQTERAEYVELVKQVQAAVGS